jgi:DNA helicase-2/ATP-dependent DNA helicase PcrA
MALSEPVLNSLNPPQRAAVTHGEGPLLILAGAGSGKTRVITCRIAYLLSEGVSPWNILAVTFTNKAAAEMRRRVDELTGGRGRGVWISTFHSFGAQFLRVEAAAAGLDPRFTIYDDDEQTQIIKEALRELSLDEKKYKPQIVLSIIGRSKDEMVDADSFAIHNLTRNDPFREMAGAVYRLYQKKLAKANALDFGDLIMRPVMALRDNEALRQKYQARFGHILVDEYQDTNHSQYLLLKYLIAPPKNLCVVGDDDQSVYSFRGADIRNIMEFERDYPGATVVKLEQNYRSTPEILAAAHDVIRRNKFRKEKKLWTSAPPGEPVRFLEFADELEEASFVARETAGAVRRGAAQPKDTAVFYRTNAQSRVLEDAFRRENVPYHIVGGQRFYERMEVKDVLAYLKVLVNPADAVSMKRIINVPARGLGKASVQILDDFATQNGLTFFEALGQAARAPLLTPAARGNIQKFLDVLSSLRAQAASPASQVVQLVLESTGYWQHWQDQMASDPEAAARLDNIQELVNAAKEYEESAEDKTAMGFLERAALSSSLDAVKDEGGAVTLMTVHLAKGLEFPAVFVTGLEEGLFPIGESAFDERELEEERRLAYVALTRAQLRLILTCAASRKIYGRSHWNVPSRFVSEAGLKAPEPPAETALFGDVKGSASPGRHFPSGRSDPGGHSHGRGEEKSVIASFDPDETSSEAPAVTGVPRPLRIGMRVRHPMFGPGRILNKVGSGENVKVTVLFDSGARKDILARYANFETLG